MADAEQPPAEGDDRIDRELFEQAIAALTDAERTVDTLREELQDIDTGLTHADTVALLYGRRNSLNKTEVKNALNTLDSISSSGSRKLLKRLLADLSDLTQSEAETFIEEVEDLRRKYGDDDVGRP